MDVTNQTNFLLKIRYPKKPPLHPDRVGAPEANWNPGLDELTMNTRTISIT